MLKKAKADAKADDGGADEMKEFARTVRDSSRQIWLAGLGAFSRAQQEGMRVFETLVEQGQSLESRTKRAASDTTASAMDAAARKAKEMQAMAGGTWDKLEKVFEDRVARALQTLGVHSKADVDRLSERVEALSEAVNELIKSSGGTIRAERRATSRKKAAKKRASPSNEGTSGSGQTDARASIRRKSTRRRTT
ncbi:MAG TPA: phasin family protein [Casimicrobiaceae bacterium]|nr:phasin family protein [Casimicrobiaceae bacterium]